MPFVPPMRRQGSIAYVVLEGEKTVRTGTVILTRGSAGTLGSNDLAALAKGRRAGVGQVLVKVTPTPDDVKACAIGHAVRRLPRDRCRRRHPRAAQAVSEAAHVG